MSDFKPLGPPRPQAAPAARGPDTYVTVHTEHGWFLRNTRTGHIEQTTTPPIKPDLDLS